VLAWNPFLFALFKYEIHIVGRLDFTNAQRIEYTCQEHARILEAIMCRDSEQAQMLLRAHIESGAAEVRQIMLHLLHEVCSQLAWYRAG